MPTAEDIVPECDWGNCRGEGIALRWNNSGDGIAAWLPVCWRHRTSASVGYETLLPAASGGATDGERDVIGQWMQRPPNAASPVVSQADEGLFNDDWWTALYLATSDGVDSVPYAAANEYPVPHAAAFRTAAEPFLRPLLADAAKVRRVEELARQYKRFGEELHDVPRAESFADVALDLRRALDQP